MTNANMMKTMLTMTITMIGGCVDVYTVEKSTVSDEYRDINLVKELGENIHAGDYHIEYCDTANMIGIWKTGYNASGKATGYMLKYTVDTENKTQLEICADLAFWLMQIRMCEKWL